MSRCLIALGSNLGDRQQTLERAVARLDRAPGIRMVAQSRWHETAPVGGPADQGPFLNGAAVLDTSLAPDAVLALLQRLEAESGRFRAGRWGPRTLDLDLLLYDQVILESAALTLPHPRMAWRRFVLEPAAEVAADMIHPLIGWTIAGLLTHLDTAVPYVAITGPPGIGKTALAASIVERSNHARLIAAEAAWPRPQTLDPDSSGNAWDNELEFLAARARLLAASPPERWSQGRLLVSDFWFGQSLAYARVGLPPGQLEAFCRRWETSCPDVVIPKLLVLIDIPALTTLDQPPRQGGSESHGLRWPQPFDRIRRAIVAQASEPGQGPLLRVAGSDLAGALAETLAAIEAMK